MTRHLIKPYFYQILNLKSFGSLICYYS